MTIACAGPDASLGVAVRLTGYLDCQARALGENGFQAVVGGPVQAGLLSGLVTIFVALIGYRLLLGRTPSLSDGVSWAVRLGVVLALVTGWPAFQTLAYRVAVDGPGELAAVLLPASGLPGEGLDERVQAAYDTMRLGPTQDDNGQPGTNGGTAPRGGQLSPGQLQPGAAQPQPRGAPLGLLALPQTASAFVITTAGTTGALRIAIGFVLAVGPLAILALLFDATLGLFSGWIRALAGAALALTAATVVTAIDLVTIEGELAHVQTYAQGGIAEVVDPQALTTMVLLFALVMLVSVLAAARMGSAFRLRPLSAVPGSWVERTSVTATSAALASPLIARPAAGAPTGAPGESRVTAVADALTASVRRERLLVESGAGVSDAPSRRVSILEATSRAEPGVAVAPLGVAGRRSLLRGTRSAQARDRVG